MPDDLKGSVEKMATMAQKCVEFDLNKRYVLEVRAIRYVIQI